jgi:hypothetical protein
MSDVDFKLVGLRNQNGKRQETVMGWKIVLMAIRTLDFAGMLCVDILVDTGDYGACDSKHTQYGVGVGMIQR